MAQEYTLLKSDHSIMADLFELAFRVEELTSEYNIKLPQLNLNNLKVIRETLNRFPKSEIITALLDSVDIYEEVSKNMMSRKNAN